MTEATDHLAFFQKKKSLQPFDIGELLAPLTQPRPTTTVFTGSAQGISVAKGL